jgi:hypothetical protein
MKALFAKSFSVALVLMFSAGAWADTPLPKTPAARSPSPGSVKWTLRVGETMYGMLPQGGPIPLPTELEWSCRYSEVRNVNNGKNFQDSVVHVTCTRSDSRFSFKTTCAHAVNKDAASIAVPPNSSQIVTLYSAGEIVPLGVSCEVQS